MSCSMSAIYVGSRPSVRMTFKDPDDVLADPDTITIRVKPPTGAVVQYVTPTASITQDSTGVWVFQFPDALTQVGKYWVHVVASGGGTDVAGEIFLSVSGSHVPAA